MARIPDSVLEEIRARLPVSAVVGKRVQLKREGAEWVGLSPFNAEKTPSFTVNDQKRFYHCFSSGKHGDIFDFVVEVEGLSFPEAVEQLAAEAGVSIEGAGQKNGAASANGAKPPQQHASGAANGSAHETAHKKSAEKEKPKREIKATYDYTDANGNLIYQVVRYEPKNFAQRRPSPDGDGAWIWGLDAGEFMRKGPGSDWIKFDEQRFKDWRFSERKAFGDAVEHSLYRVPELREALASGETILIVEGEKDADNLWKQGVAATTNSGGAKHWSATHAEMFRGADVVIPIDNDKPGRERGDQIAASLKGIAKRIRVLDFAPHWPDMKEKGDVSDWLQAGHDADELFDIIAKTPDWQPVRRQSAFGAVWFHEVGGQKPTRNWQVKNLILAKTFGLVFGPPGCGKSFLITDLMLTASLAALQVGRMDWFGYKVRPFGVIYVVAEGRDDFEIRLHAWRQDHNIGDDVVLPFVFLPTCIDMRSSDADTKKLAEEIAAISEEMQYRCGVRGELVVIDTVARVLAGGNENASEVMSGFVGNCGRLQEMLGVTVLGVHHGGKEAGRGPRGHEALHGAADFEIEVAGATEDSPNTWTVRKLKAGPGGAAHKFRLKAITVGEDEDGDPVTSCVVVSQVAQQAKGDKPKGQITPNKTEEEFLKALATAIEQNGVMPPPELGTPSNVTLVVREGDVKRAYWARLRATEAGDEKQVQDRLRARWSRAVRSMLKWNVIGSHDPWLWFTGRPVTDVTLRGVEDPAIPRSFVTRDDDDVTSGPRDPHEIEW